MLLNKKQIRIRLQQVPCNGPPRGAIAGVYDQLVLGEVVLFAMAAAVVAVRTGPWQHCAPEAVLVLRSVLELK